MSGKLNEIRLVCPECGCEQSLTVDDLPKDTKLNCSHCRHPLGFWGLIRQAASAGRMVA